MSYVTNLANLPKLSITHFAKMTELPNMPAVPELPSKPTRHWLYLTEEDGQRLAVILKKFGPHVNEVILLSMIAEAGIKAITEEGRHRVSLPFRFKILEDDMTPLSFNEPSHKRK